MSVYNNCVICGIELDFQSDEFVVCPDEECQYESEKLVINNPVTDKYKLDPEITLFMIDSAFEAIKCSNRKNIFEPYPQYFLTDKKIRLKRGEITKLAGKNIDECKDFKTLEKLIDDMPIDKLEKILSESKSDDNIVTRLNLDSYILLKFIITSNTLELSRDYMLFENTDFYKSSNLVYRVNKNVQELENSNYLFHGSKSYNWYSIIRNGLKICSGTPLMTTGAAYGNGIYLSDSLNISYNYGISGKKSVVGVFEVIDHEKYQKAPSIFVVNDEKKLSLKYILIIYSRLDAKITQIEHTEKGLVETKKNLSDLLSEKFTKNLKKEEKVISDYSKQKGLKKLAIEYKKLRKTSLDLGFLVDFDPDNIYQWTVLFKNIPDDSQLYLDMKKYEIEYINIELNFSSNYPFSPPFVRIVSPRFTRLTGHVTSEGALCMQILTPNHWLSSYTVESIIMTIISEIIEGGGRIDPNNYNRTYDKKNAIESFERVSRYHGWM